MAEISLSATPPLGGVDITIAGTRLRERDELALVSAAIPLGGEDAFAAALKAGWGLAVPGPKMSEVAGKMRAIRSTADQCLLIFPHATPDAAAVVQAKMRDVAYTTEQTDAWVRLELSGPLTLPALERVCMLDLDARAFPEGAAARTVMEHMGAILIRTGPEAFLLFSASSSARSFLHAVETSLRHVSPQ